MRPCDVQASGAVEVYFYGETPPPERAFIERHLVGCPECRRALEELSVIRDALATRPVIAAPAGGDWSRFMAGLDEAVQREAAGSDPAVPPHVHRPYVAWLSMAAVIALATFSVLFVARGRQGISVAGGPAPREAVVTPAENAGRASAAKSQAPGENNAAFLEMSEKHFERSKLVVLGLATRDAREPSAVDWAYERHLASSLLSDTRLYRIAAEQRGMATLARVMGDLELVLLQTSMSENPDPATLAQLQRLIRKRDLVTKMEVVTTSGL